MKRIFNSAGNCFNMYCSDYFFSRENLFCIFNDNALCRKNNNNNRKKYLTQCFVYMKYMHSKVYINWTHMDCGHVSWIKEKKEQRFAHARLTSTGYPLNFGSS